MAVTSCLHCFHQHLFLVNIFFPPNSRLNNISHFIMHMFFFSLSQFRGECMCSCAFLTLSTFQRRYIRATKALCLIHVRSGGTTVLRRSGEAVRGKKKASGVVHNAASKLAPWYDCALLQSAFGQSTPLSPVGTVSPSFKFDFPPRRLSSGAGCDWHERTSFTPHPHPPSTTDSHPQNPPTHSLPHWLVWPLSKRATPLFVAVHCAYAHIREKKWDILFRRCVGRGAQHNTGIVRVFKKNKLQWPVWLRGKKTPEYSGFSL